jgi:hypothetical protein
MRTLDEMQKELRKHRLEVVAADTGLAYNTVRRYATAVVKDPPHRCMELLNDWLDAQETKAGAAA